MTALIAGSHNPVDATAGAISKALPTGQAPGTVLSVEKYDASANTVTATGSIRGVGSSSIVLSLQFDSVLFVADSAGSWWPQVTSRPVPGPMDHGFAAWSFDNAVTASQTAPTSGAIQRVKLKATDTRTATALWVTVGTAGATLTTGQNLIGLYDAAGNQLAVSGDQTIAWATTGAKSATITGTPIVAGQTYYVAFLAVGTTPPAFSRGNSNGSVSNAGYASTPYRFAQMSTGQTTLPSTLTPASGTLANAWWVGIS